MKRGMCTAGEWRDERRAQPGECTRHAGRQAGRDEWGRGDQSKGGLRQSSGAEEAEGLGATDAAVAVHVGAAEEGLEGVGGGRHGKHDDCTGRDDARSSEQQRAAQRARARRLQKPRPWAACGAVRP